MAASLKTRMISSDRGASDQVRKATFVEVKQNDSEHRLSLFACLPRRCGRLVSNPRQSPARR